MIPQEVADILEVLVRVFIRGSEPGAADRPEEEIELLLMAQAWELHHKLQEGQHHAETEEQTEE